MNRRKFISAIIAAPVAIATGLKLDAPAMPLIHKGNMILPHGIGKSEAYRVLYGGSPTGRLYPYQREAIRQIELYGHAQARVWPRRVSARRFHVMDFAEVETRVLATLENKEAIEKDIAEMLAASDA